MGFLHDTNDHIHVTSYPGTARSIKEMFIVLHLLKSLNLWEKIKRERSKGSSYLLECLCYQQVGLKKTNKTPQQIAEF